MLLEDYKIKNDTVKIVGEFCIQWGYFDCCFFSNNVSPKAIVDWVQRNEDNITAEVEQLYFDISSKAKEYLISEDTNFEKVIKERIYSESNQGCAEHIHLIHCFLDYEHKEISFAGCMLFIQRIRNNLFHGLKQIYSLNNQRALFESINLLMDYINSSDKFSK